MELLLQLMEYMLVEVVDMHKADMEFWKDMNNMKQVVVELVKLDMERKDCYKQLAVAEDIVEVMAAMVEVD